MKTAKKWITAGCMGIMLLTGFTGCTKTEKTTPQTQEETGDRADSQENLEEKDDHADNQEKPKETGDQADNQADGMNGQKEQNMTDANNGTDDQADQSAPRKIVRSEGTEHLGGKVQSVADDGMIVAQTTVMGEGEDDGMVTLVDEKDAKKIPVKFTADTKVEHWIIQGGGAGIDMRDAALSDLKSGMGVELEGDYEGENFIATRILIEEYK